MATRFFLRQRSRNDNYSRAIVVFGFSCPLGWSWPTSGYWTRGSGRSAWG